MKIFLNMSLLLFSLILFSCGDNRRMNFTTTNEDGEIILSDASEKLLEELQEGYYSCHEEQEDRQACRYYAAEAICKFYDIDDFKSDDGAWMSYDDMIASIKGFSNWNLVGPARLQEVLEEARHLANDGKATVALQSDKNTGHISIILPGEMKKSGSWGMECPNSASFFRHKVEAYINKPLSYSYRSPENIVIYTRND